jgi:hypothetical protein
MKGISKNFPIQPIQPIEPMEHWEMNKHQNSGGGIGALKVCPPEAPTAQPRGADNGGAQLAAHRPSLLLNLAVS